MSRLRYLTALALSFGLLAMGVAQEKKDTPPVKEAPKDAKKEEAKAPAPAAGDNELSWKFTKDVPFYQELTTKTVQNIKVQGLDVGQNQEQTFLFKFLPLKQDGEKWIVKQTIEGLKMKIDIAGNPVSYDSTNEAATQGTNTALSDFFKAIKGSEFTLTYGKDLTVEKIEGREEFVKKLSSANKQLEPLLNKILGEEAMKQMADPSFGVTPKEKKKAGDKWDKTVVLALGPIGSYENKYTFTYTKLEGDIADIAVAVALTYKVPSADTPGEQLPFKIKAADLKQTTDAANKNGGTVKFNTKTGRIESSTIEVTLNGTLTLEIAGSQTQVTLNQTQTTLVKSSDKSFVPEKKAP